MTNEPTPADVVIVGAGVAGLSLARRLVSAGRRVQVLDKGRYPGGRMASRRLGNNTLVDHGVARFALPAGHSWSAREDLRCITQPDGSVLALPEYSGRSTASALARGLDVVQTVVVNAIEPAGDQWLVTAANGQRWRAADVVVTAPAAQTAELLSTIAPEASRAITRQTLVPRWVLVGLMDAGARVLVPLLEPLIDGLDRGAPEDGRQTLRLAASAEWSAAHVDDDADMVQAALLVQLARAGCDRIDTPYVHRWRYATPAALSEPLELDLPRGVHIAGDWSHPGAADHGVVRAIASAQAVAANMAASA